MSSAQWYLVSPCNAQIIVQRSCQFSAILYIYLTLGLVCEHHERTARLELEAFSLVI